MRQLSYKIGDKLGTWTITNIENDCVFYDCACGHSGKIMTKYFLQKKSFSCCPACRSSFVKDRISETLRKQYDINELKVYSDKEIRRKLLFVRQYIQSRCNTPTTANYKYYGALGVKDNLLPKGEDWIKLALSMGYKPGLTVDRINPYGDYEPSNIRFITISQQQRNKRKLMISLDNLRYIQLKLPYLEEELKYA